ncbi:hypothetical protein [Huintestinicola sp.]
MSEKHHSHVRKRTLLALALAAVMFRIMFARYPNMEKTSKSIVSEV